MDLMLDGCDLLGEGIGRLYVHDGRLAEPADAPADVTTVDCRGLVALPALVDPHTHLRDPGNGAAETIASGLEAAARGGYGAVFAMPNTDPVADNPAVVNYELDTASALGGTDLYPIGAVTRGQQGEALADMDAMAASRAQVRMFSDDGHCVSRSDLMRDALTAAARHGAVVAQHAQDPLLTANAQMDDGPIARELGKPGWPDAGESTIIARDVLLAEWLGARLHVCHVTTASGVDIVRWVKSRGIAVTAEATPHHLALDSSETLSQDPDFKVNPPLRSHADVEAVREAFLDGTLDMVGTDHAPHPDAAKSCSWDMAANGMLGLETALAVVADLVVRSHRMTWRELAQRMSQAPAALLGIENDHGGFLDVGRPANICLVDPDAPWQVAPEQLASIAGNTPYKSRTFHTRVVATVLRGAPLFDLRGLFSAR